MRRWRGRRSRVSGLREFKALELANAAWVFATAGQLDEALFAALARAAEPRLGEFKAQNLANNAWAFATACQLDEAFFVALVRASEARPTRRTLPTLRGRLRRRANWTRYSLWH